MKIKNITNATQCINGFKAFGPGEEREVSKKDSAYLLKCPALKEVKTKPKPTKNK